MRRAGFVLVGGRSTRMGRDKALLQFQNGTLAGSVADRVAEAAGCVALIGEPALYRHLPYSVYPDQNPGCGPLSGLQTILRLNLAEWNLMVACDLPLVSIPLMRSLLAAAAEAPAGLQCVVPMTFDGGLQPLCAVYHRSCLPVVDAALVDKRLRVMDFISGMSILRYPESDSALFRNVNTPADWAAAQS